MSTTVEKIKERLSIVDVVGSYVKLTRAGRYYKGLSPFTREKTPSFFVTPDKGLYHCFSTGKGGDMFTFVEEMERVDFKGALKMLAEKAGVELERERPGERDERDETYAALEAATVLFQKALEGKSDARAYLEKRGIHEKTIAHFRVGYALKEWRALSDALYAQGFSEAALLRAGLIKRPDAGDGGSEKKPYDRFRGRIMFPIRDASGRVVAFSGRIFEDDAVNPQAKYLNSPEGPLFDKSRALYGIEFAKNGIRTLGFSMLVEGQVDLILAHQLGYTAAVATSGTALTESHAEILKRYGQNVLIAYDGDKAGVNATYRAAELLLPKGLNVKAVALPPGVDPADLIASDPESFKTRVRSAEPVIDFFMSEVVARVSDERSRALDMGRTVLPLVSKIENALERSHYVKKIASRLGLSETAVEAELKKLALRGPVGTELRDPFFGGDARRTLLFGIYATLVDEGKSEAPRVLEMLEREYGGNVVRALMAVEGSEREAAKIVASEQFFELHSGSLAEALAGLEDEARPNIPRDTRVAELRALLRTAEEQHDDIEMKRILGELTTLLKETN